MTVDRVLELIASGNVQHTVEIYGTPHGDFQTQYEVDLPVVPKITEKRIYRDAKEEFDKLPKSPVVYGLNAKALAIVLYGQMASPRKKIRELLGILSGDQLIPSQGTIENILTDFSDELDPSLLQIESELLKDPVVGTDATSVRVNGINDYVRNFSSDNCVLYEWMEKKNANVLETEMLLPTLDHYIEHDHETAIYKFGERWKHGECNAHILRYLKKDTVEVGNPWAKKMSDFLTKWNETAKQRKAEGEKGLTPKEYEEVRSEYLQIRNLGF